MTAKTILALAQAHRKETTRQSYATLAAAVRLVVAERDALRAELFRQVALVEKCMVSMNENADRGQKAEAEVARLTPLQFRQAPCHKFCESNAYEIEARRMQREIAQLVSAARQPPTCDTCKHFKQGKQPGVKIYDLSCAECSQYYANRYEAHGIKGGDQ